MLAAEVEPDTPEEGFYRADEDDEFFAAGKGRRDESEDEEVVWRCEACSKTFKVRLSPRLLLGLPFTLSLCCTVREAVE
jgi:hypothetical protein